MEKELKYDQYHKESSGQHTDLPKVVLDVSVIRVKLRCTRRGHESGGFTHLSSVFFGHHNLLLILFIANVIVRASLRKEFLFTWKILSTIIIPVTGQKPQYVVYPRDMDSRRSMLRWVRRWRPSLPPRLVPRARCDPRYKDIAFARYITSPDRLAGAYPTA